MGKVDIKMQKDAVATQKGKNYGSLNASYEERKQWYLTARWKKFRLDYLKENPYCVRCLKKGVIEPAVIVDHIKGHLVGVDKYGKTWKDYFWDEDVQGMCWSHHSQKTMMEDRKRKPKRLTGSERKKLLLSL
jgi:hypothetical protein